jgi:multidrug efflux pump subunit AcrB
LLPVVSGDGIKRRLANGGVAAWLGPTKLATAIFSATITTIIAYLPLLMLIGNTGQFLRRLPIAMTSTRTRRRLALEPLCYAQIGGLAITTFITLQLVPVLFSIFVLDLKWIKWETTQNRQEAIETETTTM